jgi:ribosomal protein L37E
MGTSHYYTCKNCEKTVTASLVDVIGMSSKVMAVKCNDCGDIGDSTIEQHTDWNDETVILTPSCNECGSENVVKWDKTCPKCGDMMSDDGICILWD